MSDNFLASLTALVANNLPVALLKVADDYRILAALSPYWDKRGFPDAGSWRHQRLSAALPAETGDTAWSFLDEVWQSGEAQTSGLIVAGRTLDVFTELSTAADANAAASRYCHVVIWDRTDQLADQSQAMADQQTLAEFTADLPAMLYQTQGSEDGTEMLLPYLSDATQDYTGYSPAQLQADPALILAAIHPDDRQRYYDRALVSMAQLSTFRIDMRMVSSDDEATHWLRVVSHPRVMPDRSTRFSGVAVAINDLMQQIDELRQSRDAMGQFTHERMQSLLNTKHRLEQEIRQREQVHAELVEEQRSLKRLIELQDQQRRFLSYDLHDGFVQDVVGTKLILEGIIAATEPADSQLQIAHDSLGRVIEEVRCMIAELRPLAIDSEGLLDGIDSLCANVQTQGIAVDFRQSLDGTQLSQEIQSHVYRIVQESLTNVRRHAQVDRASVVLARNKGELVVEIEDCGKGFVPGEVSSLHFGLESICQRARMLGGQAQIISSPGQGTRVLVRLPLA